MKNFVSFLPTFFLHSLLPCS